MKPSRLHLAVAFGGVAVIACSSDPEERTNPTTTSTSTATATVAGLNTTTVGSVTVTTVTATASATGTASGTVTATSAGATTGTATTGDTTTTAGVTTTGAGGATSATVATSTTGAGSCVAAGPVTAAVPIAPMDGWVDCGSNTIGLQGAFFTYDDDTSAIMPADFSAAGTDICVSGTVAPSSDVVWGAGVGFNFNQDVGSDAANPWNADSLEWGTSSPPPVYNFLEIPIVEGRHALWDRSEGAPVVTGIRSDVREVLVTDVMDAGPAHKDQFPAPSAWPFLTAAVTSAMLVGLVFTPWALVVASPALFVTLVGWFWPKKQDEEAAAHAATVSEARP